MEILHALLIWPDNLLLSLLVLLFIAVPICAINYIRQPFLGIMVDNTLMISASGPSQAGAWETFKNGFTDSFIQSVDGQEIGQGLMKADAPVILVTERDESADSLVEIGPGRGELGGQLVYQGPIERIDEDEMLANPRHRAQERAIVREEERIAPPARRHERRQQQNDRKLSGSSHRLPPSAARNPAPGKRQSEFNRRKASLKDNNSGQITL